MTGQTVVLQQLSNVVKSVMKSDGSLEFVPSLERKFCFFKAV